MRLIQKTPPTLKEISLHLRVVHARVFSTPFPAVFVGNKGAEKKKKNRSMYGIFTHNYLKKSTIRVGKLSLKISYMDPMGYKAPVGFVHIPHGEGRDFCVQIESARISWWELEIQKNLCYKNRVKFPHCGGSFLDLIQ